MTLTQAPRVCVVNGSGEGSKTEEARPQVPERASRERSPALALL